MELLQRWQRKQFSRRTTSSMPRQELPPCAPKLQSQQPGKGQLQNRSRPSKQQLQQLPLWRRCVAWKMHCGLATFLAKCQSMEPLLRTVQLPWKKGDSLWMFLLCHAPAKQL